MLVSKASKKEEEHAQGTCLLLDDIWFYCNEE